ncbi:hypothetical protein [Paracoccus marcusii]|uniref:hypothetical protein n=1 Tax=Paracoccus marcusii TaxID=59779 RepID=UPI002ED3F4A0
MILSSGTMLAVTGLALAGAGMDAGGRPALHGRVDPSAGALFLMVEPMSRDDGGIAAMLALTAEIYGAKADLPSDDDGPDGPAIAAGPALLAACFALCLLALAGCRRCPASSAS